MKQNRSNREGKTRDFIIIILSVIAILVCVTVLFPQVRRMMMNLAAQIVHKEASTYQTWLKALFSYALGGICFILFFDYCTLTNSGRALVNKMKQEIKECLSEIDFKVFVRPTLLMFIIYLLGVLTIFRANFLYLDDVSRSIVGYRGWYDWSRYVSEIASIFVHSDTNLTEISPLPQLLAILILAFSSVLLVYIIGKKKITTVRLLASIPLGLSPYFIECLAFKFDAPYMALSVLASIIPFLFVAHKKAFLLISVASLLIMVMTYQAASGIYMMIVVILGFQYWNNREKSNKEILSLLGIAVLAFCFAMLLFRFFLMRDLNKEDSGYVSNSMHSIPNILIGILINIKRYAETIIHDFGITWKIGVGLVLLLFIVQSMRRSVRKKYVSLFVSVVIICLSFAISYGVYSLLRTTSYEPRALIGFGAFLACFCIYLVLDYKKAAIVTVVALNWCFFVFAFSYGNALADQARYAEFRISILLHDLSTLYPNLGRDDMSFYLKNSIDYTPSVMNISKRYPIIEKLVPKRLGDESVWDRYYYIRCFNFSNYHGVLYGIADYDALNFPVVLDSYYHTIRSDGSRVLILLKH